MGITGALTVVAQGAMAASGAPSTSVMLAGGGCKTCRAIANRDYEPQGEMDEGSIPEDSETPSGNQMNGQQGSSDSMNQRSGGMNQNGSNQGGCTSNRGSSGMNQNGSNQGGCTDRNRGSSGMNQTGSQPMQTAPGQNPSSYNYNQNDTPQTYYQDNAAKRANMNNGR